MAISATVAPGRLPLLGHTIPMMLRRADFTSALHRYGDIVTIYLGPLPSYLLVDKELVHQVLVTDAKKYERGRIFDKIRPWMGNGLATANGGQHRRQRRLMQPAFHRRQVDTYVDTMRRIVTEAVTRWRPGEVRDIDQDMQTIASTVVGQSLFSTSLDPAGMARMLHSIAILVEQSTVRTMSPSVFAALPLPANRRFDNAVAHVRRVVSEVVAGRRAAPDGYDDLLSMLLDVRDEETGDGMSDAEIHDEIVTLFIAGAETTSRALAWFCHQLGQRPDIEQRVLAELDTVLDGAPITAAHLPRLTYLRQVADEVLRHYPFWLLMRRNTEDVELGGLRLPAGTEFVVSPHALHHNPRYFPDPDRFDPDRWSPDRAGSVPRNAFIPFASGVHQCIGNSFAQAELAVVIATVFTRFRLVPVPGRPVRVKVTNLPIPSQLPMTVVPRA